MGRVGEWAGRLTAAHLVASYPAMLAVMTAVHGWSDSGDWFATAIAPVALPLIAGVSLGGVGRIVPTPLGWAAVAAVYVAGAAVVLRTWHRSEAARERLAAGRCVACGYDLRATPDRCPECGAVPPSSLGHG